MAHVPVPTNLSGISGLLAFRPETAQPLMQLANTLLRGASSLTPAERELIAAYVSRLNACAFCHRSHAAAARALFGENTVVDAVMEDPLTAPIDERMRALLRIAAAVQRDARSVSAEDVAAARAHGADDVAVHDTVLVAAAFCMYNRYVDGLATEEPSDVSEYEMMGVRLARQGYGGRARDAVPGEEA